MARLVLVLLFVMTSYAREETFGGGNVNYLLEMYSLNSKRALIVEPGVTNMPAPFTFATDSSKWPESIAAALLSHLGILVVPVNDDLALVSYSREAKYTSQIAAAQEAARNGFPTLPAVIVGGNLRFEYSIDGPKTVSRTFSSP